MITFSHFTLVSTLLKASKKYRDHAGSQGVSTRWWRDT